MGLLILIAIPTSIYFAIVVMVKVESANRRAYDRIQRAEEVKQLKW